MYTHRTLVTSSNNQSWGISVQSREVCTPSTHCHLHLPASGTLLYWSKTTRAPPSFPPPHHAAFTFPGQPLLPQPAPRLPFHCPLWAPHGGAFSHLLEELTCPSELLSLHYHSPNSWRPLATLHSLFLPCPEHPFPPAARFLSVQHACPGALRPARTLRIQQAWSHAVSQLLASTR